MAGEFMGGPYVHGQAPEQQGGLLAFPLWGAQSPAILPRFPSGQVRTLLREET